MESDLNHSHLQVVLGEVLVQMASRSKSVEFRRDFGGDEILFFDDSHQDMDPQGDPDLGFDRIVTGAMKGFDAQVLLDPAEEQFDLPALSVELGDGQSRRFEVIGQEPKEAVVLGVVEFDAPHFAGIILAGGGTGRVHGLVANPAGGENHRMRIEPRPTQPFLGPDDEESTGLGDTIQQLSKNHLGRRHPSSLPHPRSCREHPYAFTPCFKSMTCVKNSSRRLDTPEMIPKANTNDFVFLACMACEDHLLP